MDIYCKLNDVQKLFYEAVSECLKAKGECVTAPTGLSREQFMDSIEAVKYSFPELFYVDFRSVHYTEYTDHCEYNPRYYYSYSDMKNLESEIQAEADRIIKTALINDSMSIYEKCGRIHNYIVANCTYDHDAKGKSDSMWRAYTIEGCLLNKKSVCQGIAFAFKYLCSLVSVDAIVARGVSLEPGCTNYERHAWNIIMAQNEAAHIDATWDMCLSGSSGKLRYDYFFFPDLEMMRDHQYVGYPICRQLKSTYFERAGTQFADICMLGDYIKEKVKKCEKSFDDDKRIYLHFKMKNRKQTREEIEDYVNDLIRKATRKGYSYLVSVNDTQSVFSYCIELK